MLNVGRVMANEYGQVLSWEGVTWVVLVMDRRRTQAVPGMLNFLELGVRRVPPETWGVRRIACGRAGW